MLLHKHVQKIVPHRGGLEISEMKSVYKSAVRSNYVVSKTNTSSIRTLVNS